MYSMPHPQDELIINEEAFLNSSANANIDPRLLAQPQPRPSGPTPFGRTSYSAPPTHGFPLTNFYEYRHAGCLCKVKPESFPNIHMELWEPPESNRVTQNQATPDGQPIPTKLWIIHPLYCKMCCWAESQRIFYTTEARCREISAKPIIEEIKNRMIAYEEGLRDGRIESLGMSLAWSEIHGSGKGGKLAREMARLMEGLDIKSDEAVVEELVAGMMGLGVGYDVLEYDLLREFELEEITEKGVKDGIGLQERMERTMLSRRKF